MNERECPQESAVRRAVDSDGWTETLRQHVSECGRCGEVVQVTRFMKGAARAMENAVVPGARAMWVSIQFAERQRLAERARRPVRLAWSFAKYWLACGAALILYQAGPVIGDLLLTMPAYVYVAIAAAVTIVFRARRLLSG
jgi:hypothetical protein